MSALPPDDRAPDFPPGSQDRDDPQHGAHEPVGTCIFCGEPFGPDRRRSGEHAAPQWCADLLPDLGPAQHTLTSQTAAGWQSFDHGLRSPFTTVCGDVCEPCNTGWMHELEESCRTLLSHFVRGHPRSFRYWRQSLYATWALKTAMVFDAVSPQHRVIPPDVLRTHHATQRPNARQQVWIGRYSGDDPHSFRRTGAHVIDPATGPVIDSQGAHSYLAVLTIGQLCLVTFGHVLPAPYWHAFPEPIAGKLIPIWPPAHEIVSWPPAEALDDEAREATVRSLGLPIPEPPNDSE